MTGFIKVSWLPVEWKWTNVFLRVFVIKHTFWNWVFFEFRPRQKQLTICDKILMYLLSRYYHGSSNNFLPHFYFFFWNWLCFNFTFAFTRLRTNKLHELHGAQLFKIFPAKFLKFSALFASLNVEIRNNFKNIIFIACKWCKLCIYYLNSMEI